ACRVQVGGPRGQSPLKNTRRNWATCPAPIGGEADDLGGGTRKRAAFKSEARGGRAPSRTQEGVGLLAQLLLQLVDDALDGRVLPAGREVLLVGRERLLVL